MQAPPRRAQPAVRVGGAGGATYTVTPAPLAVAIDAVVDPPLDPSVRGDGGAPPPTPQPLPADGGPLAPTAVHRDSRSLLLSGVVAMAGKQLVEWEEWSATLPQSAFVDDHGGGGGGSGLVGAAAPPLAALAPAPDGSELPDLVRGPDGRQRRLTSEQVASISQRGTFVIPSQRYWGAKHTFRLPGWAVRGTEPVAAKRRERTGRAIDHLSVRLKRRLRGRRDGDGGTADGDGVGCTRFPVAGLSVAAAARHAVNGVVGLADLLVGVPHRRPETTGGHDLLARAAAEEAAYVATAAEAQATAAHVADRRRHGTRLVRIVAAVRAEAAGEPLADAAVSTTDADAVTVLDDLLARAMREPPPATPDADGDSPSAATLADGRAAVIDRATKLPSLVRAEMTGAARRQLTAAHVVADVLAKMETDLAERKAAVEAAVDAEHPQLAAGPGWRAAEVARRLNADANVTMTATIPPRGTFLCLGRREEASPAERTRVSFTYKINRFVFAARNAVVEALAAAGDDLADEAADERARLAFWRDHWPAMEAAVLGRRVAAAAVTRRWVRWRTQSWKVTTDLKTTIEPFARHSVVSGRVGWRLSVAAATAGSIANNGAYLAATTALSGRFGVRALFTRAPFAVGLRQEETDSAVAASDDDIDGGTISRHLARRRVRQTAARRLADCWVSVAEERRAFEATPDVGLVPKAAVRWLHYVTNYAVRGGLGSVGLFVGLPLATAVTLVACALGAAATPVIAVATAAVEYVGSALLWDVHAPDSVGVVGVEPSSLVAETRAPARHYRRAGRRALHLVPLPRRAAQVVALGGGHAIVATAAAGVYHPVAGALTVAAAAAAAAARTVVDAAATAALRRVGRQPATDTWLAARIGGPGVSASYFYRLDDAVIARAVRGRLEELELDVVQAALEAAIAAPADAWATYVAHTGAIAAGVDGDTKGLVALAAESSTGRRLAAAAAPRAAALREVVAARRLALRPATAPHPRKGRLRPAGDPAAAAAAVEAAVGAFVRERLGPLGGDAATAVARAAGVPPGDHAALARAIVRDVFGPHFYTPLAESDETLQIPVSFPPLLARP